MPHAGLQFLHIRTVIQMSDAVVYVTFHFPRIQTVTAAAPVII